VFLSEVDRVGWLLEVLLEVPDEELLALVDGEELADAGGEFCDCLLLLLGGVLHW